MNATEKRRTQDTFPTAAAAGSAGAFPATASGSGLSDDDVQAFTWDTPIPCPTRPKPPAPVKTDPAGLDLGRVANLKPARDGFTGRCPACHESGGDNSGDHLFVDAQGRFGCVAFPGADGAEHRKRIFALVGTVEKAAARPRKAVSRKPVDRTWADPQAAAKACTPRGFALAAVYDYPKAGQPFAAVARFENGTDKTFRQFALNGAGWKAAGPGAPWPLYRVEALPPDGAIFVVEGEKCQHAAAAAGLPAVTSAGGSKAAARSDWTPIQGRDVCIVPDADPAGDAYAKKVAAILAGLGCRVRILHLPGLPTGGDVADFLDAGGDAETIKALSDGAPEWQAPPPIRVETAAATEDPIAAARAGQPFAQTDLGNAERFVRWHGDAVRWDVSRKAWRAWDGRRWAIDSALRVNTLAAETARKIRREAAAAPSADGNGNDLGQELFKHAVRSESRDRLAAMLEVAKSQPGIAVAADELDADPWKLNLANGTLDLRKGELRPHNRADMLTKLAPVEYRPGARCERWERFLHDATGGDAELVAFLQVAAGYTLTGDTSEEVLFMVYGPEASGKTTFLETLRATLGEYARTISTDLLTKSRQDRNASAASPELACLAGARLAAASELEQGRELAEALAKNLTGGEPITARHLYAELFDFRPQFKIWLALNHCPRVSADDGAIWRRIRRIGFEHTVPTERRDKTLKPYLRDSDGGAPAVLAWAVEGCLRWQREGLRIPPAVERSTAAYRNESDPLAVFFEDCLTFNPLAWTPAADILKAYHEHCDENKIGERYRVSPKRVSERLKAHGCTPERHRDGRGWLGVEVQFSGDRDACDACDTIRETFLREEKTGKVLDLTSQASQASHKPPDPPDPDTLDGAFANVSFTDEGSLFA